MNWAEPTCLGPERQQRGSHILISSRFEPVAGYTGISANNAVKGILSRKKTLDSGLFNSLESPALTCMVDETSSPMTRIRQSTSLLLQLS